MKVLFHALLTASLVWLTGCESMDYTPEAASPDTNQPVTAPEPEPAPALVVEPLTNVAPVQPETIRTNTIVTEPAKPWLGLQLFVQTDSAARALAAAMPELANMGVNAIIVETGYCFEFRSHPELIRGKGVSRAAAKYLAAVARTNGVRLIPELDCLGHQSLRSPNQPLKRTMLPLLATYPEFTEPSPAYPDLKTDYLKNWCPNNPRVEPIVFDLIDEIGEAFDADAFHVGMDEIFNLASDNCPRCRGNSPAELLAKVINHLHTHIVETNKWEMFIWGDRLLDGRALGYSKWEGSQIGTARAIDLIPKDIVICDWHYGQRTNYPSVPLFLAKGFRVWPAGFQPIEASKAFSRYTMKLRANNLRLVGYLCTTWSSGKPETVAAWPPVKEILNEWHPVANTTTNSITSIATNIVTNAAPDTVTNIITSVTTNSPAAVSNNIPETTTNIVAPAPPN